MAFLIFTTAQSQNGSCNSFLHTHTHPYTHTMRARTHICRVGGVGGMISHLCQIFCYAFQRMNTSRLTQTERTGKSVYFNFFMYHVLNDCKCEDSSDGAFVV